MTAVAAVAAAVVAGSSFPHLQFVPCEFKPSRPPQSLSKVQLFEGALNECFWDWVFVILYQSVVFYIHFYIRCVRVCLLDLQGTNLSPLW
jgi:hypothetical protein